MLGWESLGGGPDGVVFNIIESFLMVLQLIATPILLALEFFILVLPFLIGFIFSWMIYNGSSSLPDNNQYWQSIFSSDLGQLFVNLHPVVWVVEVYWIIVCCGGWKIFVFFFFNVSPPHLL